MKTSANCLVSPPRLSLHSGTVEFAKLPGLAIASHCAPSRRIVPAGREIYVPGRPAPEISVVTSGWAFVYSMLEDGRRQILDFALPGAVLGLQAESGLACANAAETVTDVTLAVLPRAKLGEILAREPNAGLWLANATAQALERAYEAMTDIGRRTAREAVAHFLLRLFKRAREAGLASEGDSLLFPLRQDHIGDALGLTAVHVCRTLAGLRTDGIVVLGKGWLRVTDWAKLAAEAGVEADESAPCRSRLQPDVAQLHADRRRGGMDLGARYVN